MSFSIKPPLYAVDANQINDLLYAENFHSNIGSWLRNIKNFPIEKRFSFGGSTGLLLFERFTPWVDNWCEDYTTKLYQFYKYISLSSSYQSPYFNGYGLLDSNYGNMLVDQEDYDFNIPPSITLTNSANQFISITYLQKSYSENFIYFDRVDSNVEMWIKRVVRIPPLSVVKLLTENILCCSMVLNAPNDLTPSNVGIPNGLDYEKWDDHLNNITAIIDNNYPYLHKRIAQIDYKVTCSSWVQYDQASEELTAHLNYEHEWIAGSLVLGDIPNWYYSAALIYANNDHWGSGETLKLDLGKPLNVIVYSSFLEYSFLFTPDSPSLTSNLIDKPILPENVTPFSIIGVSILRFSYRPGVGIHTISSSGANSDPFDPITRFRQSSPFTSVIEKGQAASGVNESMIARGYVGTNAYTNSGICRNISPVLFSSVDGLISAYNSLLIEINVDYDDSDPNNFLTTWSRYIGLSRFVYNGSFNTLLNNFILTSDVEEQQASIQSSVTTGENVIVTFPPFQSNSQGVVCKGLLAQSESTLNSFFLADNAKRDEDYEVTKTLTFSIHTSDPRTIKSNTDQEIIDFVNNIIVPTYSENIFMADSLRIIEIHEALNAGKFANDPNDSEVFRFANLGYYIERIARVLGISVDPDGSIRSVRQRGFKESGDTIPAGWPVGQWGRNQGGSTDGQKGGNPEDDRDGITYPVISNKFSVDPFTGEPSKIIEGGYVQCENIIQYLETLKDDLDKALGLQYAGANSFPLPNGNGDISIEGLSILLQENTYMLSQLSCQISSAQISSLVTQAVVAELLAHCGVPTTIKELKVDAANGETFSIPYPAITENSPSQFDQTLWLLSNLASLLGGKINLRQDQRIEES